MLLIGYQAPVYAQVSITTNNTYYENFDGMGTSATATLPAGFRVNSTKDWTTGTTATTQAAGTTGTGVFTGSSAGGYYNLANGVTGTSTERALGILTTGSFSSPRVIIFAFTNNTGTTINDIQLVFDYEKYRSGSRQFDWTFFHGATATSISTAATVGDESFPADANNTTIYNPPTTITKTVLLSGLGIANGSTYYFAWQFTGAGGSTNGQAQGIDNFAMIFPPTVNYSQNFGTAAFSAYPRGFYGRNQDGTAISTQSAAESTTPSPVIACTNLTAQSGAFSSEPSGGLYGIAISSNGRLCIATSNSATTGLNQPFLTFKTGSVTTLDITYDLVVLYSGTRSMGIALQYRSGVSGSWTTISGSPQSYGASPTLYSTVSKSHTLTGLSANTIYQLRWITWRDHASGSSNTSIGLDNINLSSTVAPTVTTSAITGITTTSANGGGNVTSDGGASVTARGIVWGTSPSPSLPGLGNTTDGTGTGSFSSSIPGTLSPQTQYHVRAYATNSVGTGYGSNVSFYTLSNQPTAQADNLIASAVSSSQIDLTWDAATFPTSGATVKGYVLLRATHPSTPTFTASNGQAPSAGVGVIVSSSITDPSITYSNTGLAAGTTYNYLLIPYCWDGTNAGTYHYLTSGAQTASATTFSASCSEPTIQVGSLNISGITTSTMNISWTLGNGNRTIIIVKEGSAVDEWPVSGNAYTAGATFGTGANLGSFNYVCYYGTGTSFTLTGLTPGTTYHIAALTVNHTGYCYMLTSPFTASGTTTASSGFIETFEPGTKAAYTNGNATCNMGLWNFNDALIGTAAQDKKNGAKSARIQANGSITMLFDKANGAGVITVRHAVYGTDAASTWRVEVSNNYGASFDAYISPTITTSNTTLQTQTFTANVSGDIRIRIVKLSGTLRLNIDDIEIENYIPANIITTGVVSGSPYCITDMSGESISVPFTSTGTFGSGNVYTVQLSDATGSFAIPQDIGTLNSDANSGTISAIIPAGTFNGSNYKIRVVSSDPVVTGSSTAALTVYLNTPDVSNLYALISSGTSVTLAWTNPSACYDQILVVGKASSAVTALPGGDGTAYTANSVFSTGGSGASLPTNEYAVYKGTGSSVTVTGLTSGTTYFFKVFVRKGFQWSPGVIISAEPIPVQTGDYRTKQNGNYNAASTWEIYNGSAWVNASTWPNSAGTFPGTINVTISHTVTLTTSIPNSPIYNLTVLAGGKLWTNDSTYNGNRYLTIFGDILCNGTIGNAFNKYDNVSFNIEGITSTINGTGGFYASRLRKSYTNNTTTHLIIAKNIALKFNSGLSGSSGTEIYNNVSGSTFNITINPNTTVDLLVSTGTSGNISIDGIDGQGSGERGGTVTVNGTLNVPGTLFLLTDNATRPVVYEIGNTGVINCVNICTGNTAVTSPVNLTNGSHTGTSTLRILNGGRLNLTGGSSSDPNTFNKPFSLRTNTSSPYTYTAGLGTNSNTIYDFQPGSIVEYSNTSGTMPVQCTHLTYSNIVFSNGGIKSLNNTLNVNRDLSIFSPAVLNTNSNTINIGGDWYNYGSIGFTEANSTVVFNGTNTQSINTPTFENFYNLTISNASTGGVILNTNLNIANDLELGSNGRLFFGGTPATVTLTNMTDASNTFKGTGSSLMDLSGAPHNFIIGCQNPSYSGSFNAGTSSLVSYNRNSAISGTTGNQNVLTNITYANLIVTGTDNKYTNNDFTVNGNFTIDGNTTVLHATASNKTLTLGGNLTLSFEGTMNDNCFHNLNIITSGNDLQTFDGQTNTIKCLQLQSIKTGGGLQLEGPSANTILAIKNDLRINYTGSATFTDNDNTIEVGDDAELGGASSSNYNLTGTLKFTMAGTPASTDAHLSDYTGSNVVAAHLHNITIEPVSGAEVSQLDFMPLAGGQTITIKNNLNILNTNATGTLLHPRSNTIKIAGNWNTYSHNGFEQTGSTVEFNAPSVAQSFFSGDKEVFDNVIINTNVALLMNAPVELDNQLTLTNGLVQTGVHTLYQLNPNAASLVSYNNHSYVNGRYRRNVNTTGTYIFPVGTASHLQDAVITLNSSAGMSNILAFFTPGLPVTMPNVSTCIINGAGVNNMLDGGFWTIEPDAYTAVNYDVELRQRGYTNFSGTPTLLGVIKRTNSSNPWLGTNLAGVNGFHNNGTQTISGGVATAIRTSVNSFSDFGIGFNGNPLPVQLTAFDAVLTAERKVLLSWTTESELNSDYFEVERSADATYFERIGTVDAAGFSTHTLKYNLTDENPLNGVSYYRLKQVDFDGTFEYSNIRSVRIHQIQNQITAYPMPVYDVLFIKGLTADVLTQITISDISGRVISEYSEYNPQQVDLSSLVPGQYFLRYVNSYETGVITLIKQ